MMTKFLDQVLRQDETVLWEGAPSRVEVIEPGNKLALILRWCGCTAFAALAIFYWAVLAPSFGIPPLRGACISLVTLAVCFAVAVTPVLNARQLPKVIRFAVTDRRLLVCNGKKQAYTYRTLNDFTSATVERLPNGTFHVFFGPVAHGVRRRTHDTVLVYTESYRFDPLVFSCLEEVDSLLAVLPDYIQVNGRPDTHTNQAA